MDCNKRFLEIVTKYFQKEDFTSDEAKIMSFIKKSLERVNDYKNIAIWGAGQHTNSMFRFFSSTIKNTKFIIDANTELANIKFGNAYKILENTKQASLDSEIDCIIVSSFAFRKDIVKTIKKWNLNIHIIDIYEDMQKIGIISSLPFYVYANAYTKINELQLNTSEKNLIALILEYAKIKDFINLKRVSTELKIRYNNVDYEDMVNEIYLLIDEMKCKIKHNKNITTLWFMDSVRNKDVNIQTMPFITSWGENNTRYMNMFSTGYVTYESLVSAFTGQYPLDNENYKREYIQTNESSYWIDRLNDNGEVTFYIPGHDKFLEDNRINYKTGGAYASSTLWNYFVDRVENKSKNKKTYLVYFVTECHPPHLGGYHSKKVEVHYIPFSEAEMPNQTQIDYELQYHESLKYLDEQICFYGTLMGLNNVTDDVNIIFSDHGQLIEQATKNIEILDTVLGWSDDWTKVFFACSTENKNIIYNLNSYIDMNELLKGEGKDFNRKIIKSEFSARHNKITKSRYVQAGKKDYVFGYRVFRNLEYKVCQPLQGNYRVFKVVDGVDIELTDKDIKEDIISKFKIKMNL